MTQAKTYFEPLNDLQRLAYLQAMEVAVWVPRDQPEPVWQAMFDTSGDNELTNDELQNKEFKNKVLNNKKLADNVQTESQRGSGNNSDKQLEAGDQQSDSSLPEYSDLSHVAEENERPTSTRKIVDTELVIQAAPSIKTTAGIKTTDKSVNSRFLKMVNWLSKSEADKNLLVICRHQKDQPAQSFARPNAPSQFMRDYLATIDEYLNKHDFELQVHLAHLSEAGLGNDCQPMAQKVEQITPELILLLGDEGVRQLFNSDSQVAEFRGKLHQLGDYKVLVSYHPYTLIKNPALKKLALEDLKLLVDILIK